MIYGTDKLMGLHPMLWASVGYLGACSAFDWKITSGSRSPETQASLFAIGRTVDVDRPVVTNASAGQSAHEYGLALDIYPTMDKGTSIVMNSEHPAWKEKDTLLSRLPGVKPVTNIASGRDLPHVEVSDWQIHRDWKRNFTTVAAVLACVALMGVFAK